MSETTLSLAQQALSTPNGTKRALSLLETQVDRNKAVEHDSTIWACIAHLRKKLGDDEGAETANLRAKELVDVLPRKLVFDDDADAVRGKCGEMLVEIMKEGNGDDGNGDQPTGMRRVERLVARSKRLREISEGVLRGG